MEQTHKYDLHRERKQEEKQNRRGRERPRSRSKSTSSLSDMKVDGEQIDKKASTPPAAFEKIEQQ